MCGIDWGEFGGGAGSGTRTIEPGLVWSSTLEVVQVDSDSCVGGSKTNFI